MPKIHKLPGSFRQRVKPETVLPSVFEKELWIMKKLLAILLASLLVLSLAACGGKPETAPSVSNTTIRLSTTTSVNDSGLLPYLLPVFEKASGYTVEVQSAGTGAAVIEWPAPSRTSDLSIACVPVKFTMFVISVTVSPVCSAHAMAFASVV